MWTLFTAERANSYHAIENRRGTPSFKIEEVNNFSFLCGRNMAEDLTSTQPLIHRQDAHHLLKDIHKSKFMVPILNPHTPLGRAVAQTLHDECCGSSPATSWARASRYFYFSGGSASQLFRILQEDCFKYRRICMFRGRDLINPLRHLSDTTMVPGLSL